MDPRPAGVSNRSASQKIFLAITAVISVACLVWVLHDIDAASLGQEIAAMHWGWVTVAVLSDIAVFLWQGWRWSLLLRPLAEVPFWRSVRAIYVGLFANEVLPFRTGELIRCYLQARWSSLPFSVTLSSALIERIFDGIWLIIFLYVTVRFVELPRAMIDGGIVLTFVLVFCALLLAAAMFHKQKAREVMKTNRILSKLTVLLDDLHIIGHSKYLYFSAFASFPYLLMQIVPIYALLKGYGIDLSLGASAAIMVILRLGSVIPQAPGNVGMFQALAVIGLQLFGVEQGLAKRFSLVLWGVITLPLLITGFIALAITGLKLGELRRHVQSGSEDVPTAPPGREPSSA